MAEIELNRYWNDNIPVLKTSIDNDVAEITEYMGYNEGELYCIAVKNSDGQLIRGLRQLIKDKVICICEDDEYHLIDSDIELYLNHYPKRADIMTPYSLESAASNISQQFIEDCYYKMSVTNNLGISSILFLDGKKIEFINSTVIDYTESKRYVDPTRIFNATFVQSYRDELRKLHRIGTDCNIYIEEALVLQAYCYTTLNINQLNSREATKIFAYENGATNYIALAAFFNTAEVTYDEFTASIFIDEYEDISNVIIDGVNAKRIKAFGKIFDLKVDLSSENEPFEEVSLTNLANNNSEGYVYVLINPTMEGFVKIGKTTHHPRERAKELSSATGVASPFIVAYFRQFHDCHNAEKLAHKELESRGVRYNSSREFFRIETHEAIEVISKLPNEETKGILSVSTLGYDRLPVMNIDSSLDAEALFKEADYFKSIEDVDSALAYCKLSSMKSFVYADRVIGDILFEGCHDVLMNLIVNAYMNGTKKGDITCYYKLAYFVYGIWHKDFVKADTCWSLYFDNIDTAINEYESRMICFELNLSPFSAINNYLKECLEGNTKGNTRAVMEKYIPMFRKYKTEILVQSKCDKVIN